MAYASFDQPLTLTRNGSPILISSCTVTGNFFAVLGVVPQYGRFFAFENTWASGSSGIVLSDRFWRDELRADRSIIGKSIVLDGRARTVLGTAPPAFDFPAAGTAVWTTPDWAKTDVVKDGFGARIGFAPSLAYRTARRSIGRARN
jgi:hypothetical protein